MAPVFGFPRLYAAASLKLERAGRPSARRGVFSAALCRGLIEAPRRRRPRGWPGGVFRGFMPRPH